MDLFNLLKALNIQQDQDEDSDEIHSKNGVVVGSNDQINKFLAGPNGKRHQQVKIVKKPNPKKGTRLLTYNLKKSLHQLFVACKDESQKKEIITELHESCETLSQFCTKYSVGKSDDLQGIAIVKDRKTFKSIENCVDLFKNDMILLELIGETKGDNATGASIQLLDTCLMKQFGKIIAK